MDRLAHYIGRQPDVVEACAQFARSAFAGLAVDRGLAMVASGSSLNALLSVAPAVRNLVGELRLYNPLDFLDDLAAGRCAGFTVLVLSQSGASQTSIDAVVGAVAQNLPTYVLTADARAAIGGAGGVVLEMPIGNEALGPKTMGYTGSLIALFGLIEALGGLTTLPVEPGKLVAQILESYVAPARALANAFADIDYLMTAARGRHQGTSAEAALKIAEIAGVPAASFPLEELQHGRLHAMSTRSATLVFADAVDDLALAEATVTALHSLGLKAWIVNLSKKPTPYDAFPLLPQTVAPFDTLTGILPFQLVAHAMAVDRGIDPGEMKYPDMSKRLGIKTERRS